MNEHIFLKFDAELDKLRSRLIKMGTLLQQQIDYVIKALESDDKVLAELVVKNDDKIDKIDIKIDKQCMRIFAQLQPVASDLRITMSALSINDNMELIGDIIVDIAKTVGRMPETEIPVERERIIRFGKVVSEMITLSLDSFIYANTNLAKDVVKQLQTAKALFYESFDFYVSLIKSNPESAGYCLYLNDINRNLKFISDLAVNVAHEIIFIVEARIVKHNFQLDKEDIYEEDEKKENNSDEK
jgi:phosphate transport system protein